METIVVTCEAIKSEVLMLFEMFELDYQCIWLDTGLHRSPERLRLEIIEQLKKIDKPSRILMPMGSCGGGVDNIPTGKHTLVVPKCDDCISLMVGSMQRRLDLQREAVTMFLTGGWLNEKNDLCMLYTYRRAVERMGEEKALRGSKMAIAHYERYLFIETGAYDVEEAKSKIGFLAEKFEMDIEQTHGDLKWLEKMLTGPWLEEDFLIANPGETLQTITMELLDALPR